MCVCVCSHEKLDYEGRKTIERDQFRMVHYAGDVTYSVTGFVDKNNDLLYRNLKEVRYACSIYVHVPSDIIYNITSAIDVAEPAYYFSFLAIIGSVCSPLHICARFTV